MTFLQRLRQQPALLARVLLAVGILFELAVLKSGPSAAKAKQDIAAAKAAGDSAAHWEPIADIGIHHAALINLVMLVLLLVTAGLWTRSFTTSLEDDPLERAPRPAWQRWLLPWALIFGFAAFYGSTSFGGKSLWWDEMWAVKNCVVGTWKPAKKTTDESTFQSTTWKKCAYYYQKPTNHAPMSLAQKASLSVWRQFTGAGPSEFTELAVRMPAFLASGIAVLLLMRLIGMAKGVTVGALLLMLHPWHLRYGVEARAYAFIVPLCISGMVATRRVIFTRGRDVWPWVWLALNQALWIWTYPNAVLDVLVLFIVLGVFLWRGEENKADRITAMVRLITAHVLAAMLWMQLFLPNLLQALQWAGQEDQGHQLNSTIFKNTLCNLAFGMDWGGPSSTQIESQGLNGLVTAAGNPTLATLMLVIAFGLSLTGLLWAVAKQPRTGWLLAAPLISSTLYAGIGAVFGIYFYARFVIALLPVFVAGLSLCGWAFSYYTQVHRRIVLGVMVLFVFATQPQRSLYATRPYSGFRQAAERVQQFQSAKPPLVLCYGLGREVINVYVPDAKPAANAADLTAAKAQAKTEGRDLLVIQGYSIFNRARLPDGMALLDDRAQFEELGAYPGIEPDFFFRVLRAK